MHFSTALVAALSISASTTSAIPLRHAHPGSSAQAVLARNNAEGHLARRNVEALVARGVGLDAASAKEGRTILARYAHITDDSERSMAVVRDLHRRGVLDMLVAAIRDIIVELLGSSGMARRQEAQGDDSHEELVDAIACLINQMVGVDGGAKCSSMSTSASSSTNATTAAATNSTRTAVLDTSSPEKTKASLSKLLSQVSLAMNDDGSAKSNSTMSADHKGKGKKKDAAASSTASSSAATATTSAAAVARDASQLWARDLELMARQEGVEGLLQVLRSLVDAILNTLLPMSSRDEDSSSSSASSSFGKNCPSPGTPNDGMYRPGCPGYGRRSSIPTDIVLSQRDASSLQSLLPMINMLIENLPSLLKQTTSGASATGSAKSAAATTTDDSAAALASLLGLTSASPSSASAAAATATGAAAKKNDSAGSAASGSSSSSSSASTPKSSGKADKASAGQAPISAAKLSINSRDLLDADGFEMAKRYDNSDDNNSQDDNHGGIQISALNDVLNNLLGSHGVSRRQNNEGGGSSQDGNQGGIQVSVLDNLLNGLLGGLLGGNSDDGTSASVSAAKTNSSDKSAASDATTPTDTGNNAGGGSSQDGNSNGINVSILNDLLNGLLGGLLGGNSRRANVDDNVSQSGNHGGINVQLLNGLLNNLLGSHSRRANVDDNVSQSGNHGGLNVQVLNGLLNNLLGSHARRALVTVAARRVLEARADFAPVWTEIKKLGNTHFDTPQRRDATEGFAPVWSSFRDMVDSAYAEGADAHNKRAPMPTVDTKPFAKATSKFIKQKFFSVKRSQQDFAPVLNAAGDFAKSQMKEWTAALNEHNKAKAH